MTRVRLLIASLLLALIPSLWASYALLGIGSRYGSDMLTVVYAFGGVGSIVGSFVYMRLSAKLGMRAVSAIGAIATAISLAAVLVPEFAAVCVGWLINNLGYGLLAHGVIVSRQLLLSGGDLAKFSGRARFAYAIGGAVGTRGAAGSAPPTGRYSPSWPWYCAPDSSRCSRPCLARYGTEVTDGAGWHLVRRAISADLAVLMYAGVDVRRGSQPHCCVIDAAR